MKVLHVAAPATGGVPRVVRALAEHQADHGWAVAVAAPADGDLGDLGTAGVQLFPWRAARSPHRGLLRETATLRAIVRAARPDVIHLHSSKAGLVGRLVVRGRIPTLYQPHAWSWWAVSGVAAAFARRWERIASRWTHLVVTVSEEERLAGERCGLTAPSVVVANGVDTDAFRPLPQSLSRSSLRLPAASPIAVCVGRLERQKGQVELVAAWPRMTASLPEAMLVLVGGGSREGELRALVDRLGLGDRVRLVGPQTDVATWYAAADVVLMPSRWEGMALSPLEAQACGRVVVTTDVAGARQSIGPHGRVVAVGDMPSLVAAAEHVLADRQALPDREQVVRRWAVERLGLGSSLARTTELTARVAASSPVQEDGARSGSRADAAGRGWRE